MCFVPQGPIRFSRTEIYPFATLILITNIAHKDVRYVFGIKEIYSQNLNLLSDIKLLPLHY